VLIAGMNFPVRYYAAKNTFFKQKMAVFERPNAKNRRKSEGLDLKSGQKVG